MTGLPRCGGARDLLKNEARFPAHTNGEAGFKVGSLFSCL